jgi:hypothetical protein
VLFGLLLLLLLLLLPSAGELLEPSRQCSCLSSCDTRLLLLLLPPAGELQEPSKRAISRVIEAQDQLVEQAKDGTEGDSGP